jgi:Bacterial PH domain
MSESRPRVSLPLVRRIPPWQPAVLFLLAAGCAALNLYGHPSSAVRAVTIGFGVVAVVSAVIAMRLYLVVDEHGIGIRRFFGESSIDWSDVSDVTVARAGYSKISLRVVRRDGSFVTVPASLVLPTRPTSTRRVLAQLGEQARQILACGEPYRRD